MPATGVLLTSTEPTAAARLTLRDIGSGLEQAIARSGAAPLELEAGAPPEVRRVATDDRTVGEIALEVLEICGWA